MNMRVYPRGGGGGVLAEYVTGGPTELHIATPKKFMSLKLYTQKNNWHQNFLRKNTRFSTSILTYSIKQTLRSKNIRDRSLDTKKYRGCKFSTQKNSSDHLVMYTAGKPSWGGGGYMACI